MVVEEGTKRVNETIETVNRTGDTIGSLGDAIAENARAAAQISAATNQQVTGITQIQQAMNDVNVATGQNASASRQAEEVAQSLHQLGARLRVMLAGEAPRRRGRVDNPDLQARLMKQLLVEMEYHVATLNQALLQVEIGRAS